MITIYCKLVAKDINPLGYITYVFESLESTQKDILKTNYLMCVQFPNWDQADIIIGDEGFLNYQIVRGGIDKWFDGNKFIPYRYTNVQFLKFIPKPKKADNKQIITD